MKKLLFTVATMVLSVSAFFGTTGFYASAETAESEEAVPLYIENEEVTVTDNAITFSAELMMDSARANVPDVAGYPNGKVTTTEKKEEQIKQKRRTCSIKRHNKISIATE